MKHVLIRYWPHIVLSIVGLFSFKVFYDVYQRVLYDSKASYCPSNLKQMGLAIIQYSQDYNERLPLVRVQAVAQSLSTDNSTYGWADALYPYSKSAQILQCPIEENHSSGNAVESQYTDYYYNSNLDGIQIKSIVVPDATVLFGEGNDGKDGSDARYNRNVIPKIWIEAGNSPVYRHMGGAFYAFADGHVKWFKPDRIHASRYTRKNDEYSFAVKQGVNDETTRFYLLGIAGNIEFTGIYCCSSFSNIRSQPGECP